MKTVTKKGAKPAAPRVDKKLLVLKTQEVVSRSHQTKLRNDLKKLKALVVELRSAPAAEVVVQEVPVVAEPVNLLDQVTSKMTGTTGTTYTPLFATIKGRVGIRNLGGETFRVRIQPAKDTKLSLPNGWTTPGYSENTRRYSIVTKDLPSALKVAGAALLA